MLEAIVIHFWKGYVLEKKEQYVSNFFSESCVFCRPQWNTPKWTLKCYKLSWYVDDWKGYLMVINNEIISIHLKSIYFNILQLQGEKMRSLMRKHGEYICKKIDYMYIFGCIPLWSAKYTWARKKNWRHIFPFSLTRKLSRNV